MVISNKELMSEFKVIEINGKKCSTERYKNTHTYIIYCEQNNGKSFLLDLPSLFVKEKSINSIDTSVRYANIIKKFFNWYATEHQIDKNFWQKVWKTDLQDWQVARWTERENKGKKSPSNKTILEEAVLIAEMYDWIHRAGYFSGVKIEKKEVEINFGDSDMLNYLKSGVTKEVVDSLSLQVINRESTLKNIDFSLMEKEHLETFMNGFSDNVFVCIFYLILFTGLRRSEVVQIPYIGERNLIHVRQFKEMNLENRQSDYFRILVLGKGKNSRSPKIQTLDWLFICELYESDLIERRKIYKQKYGKRCPNNILWLTKTGEPVTRKMITDAFAYNSKKTGIDIHPHFGRGWYATTFIGKSLGDKLDTSVGYNAAIDEDLRIQLGHTDIKTTYTHYVKMAKLYKNINTGFTTDLFTEENSFSLEFKGNSSNDLTKIRRKPVKPKNKLLIIRGLPGSGKSTLAKLLSAYNHYETDMYFMKHGVYKFRQNQLQAAHNWCEEQVRTNLQAGNDVVVSNSFISLNEMKPYMDMGFDYDVMTASGEYKNIHNIIDMKIAEMKERWEDYDKAILI